MGVFGQGIFGQGVFGGVTSLATTVQDTYPDRVAAVASNITPGQVVTISRTVAGETTRTAVRGADEITATSGTLAKIDAEAPAGILITYILTVDGTDLDTETETLALEGVAISDAIAGNSAQVVILSWPSKKRDRQSSVFPVAGRNIVVSGQRGGFSGQIDIFCETTANKLNLLNLLQTATSGVLQIRVDRTQTSEGVDCYISVLSDDEQRWSQDGSDERRIISLDVVEATPWGPTLEAAGAGYDDLAAAYVADDYSDLAADYATYLDLQLADLT